jgi:hypothetical protein
LSTGRVKNILYRFQTDSWFHPASCTIGTRGTLSPAIKLPGHEADHSPPNSAMIKKIIRMAKSRRMRWAWYIAQIRAAYRILVGKPEGKRTIATSKM